MRVEDGGLEDEKGKKKASWKNRNYGASERATKVGEKERKTRISHRSRNNVARARPVYTIIKVTTIIVRTLWLLYVWLVIYRRPESDRLQKQLKKCVGCQACALAGVEARFVRWRSDESHLQLSTGINISIYVYMDVQICVYIDVRQWSRPPIRYASEERRSSGWRVA